MYRTGIRVQDVFDRHILEQKVEGALEFKNQVSSRSTTGAPSTSTRSSTSCSRIADRLRPMVADTSLLLDQALDARRDRAARGRTGDPARRRLRHLPVRHVVERHGRRRLHRRRHPADPHRARHRGHQGIHDPRRRGSVPDRAARRCTASYLRTAGGEFGTTTGRPRRCGWIRHPIARYAARVNGVTDFVLTKLDVLTGLDRVPVCVAYDIDGTATTRCR